MRLLVALANERNVSAAGREPLRRQFVVVRLAGRDPTRAEERFLSTL